MIVANNKIDGDNKYTSNAGNFDGHADTAVRCGAHHPMELSVASCKATNATIGQVPAPYCPGGCHGGQV
jgi:hypothetical protein